MVMQAASTTRHCLRIAGVMMIASSLSACAAFAELQDMLASKEARSLVRHGPAAAVRDGVSAAPSTVAPFEPQARPGSITSPPPAHKAPADTAVPAGIPPDDPVGATQLAFAKAAGDRVFFTTDSTSLAPRARRILRRQADWLRRHPHITITLIGHGDDRGSDAGNLLLGQGRADAVQAYLAAHGVAPVRMVAISRGNRQPFHGGTTAPARALNRRVVTIVR